jgi:hypothetical protein
MNKIPLVMGVIAIFILSTITSSAPSPNDREYKYDKHIATRLTPKIKIERRFLFANVMGKIEIKDVFYAKEISPGLYTRMVINGTVICDLENLDFFTIWPPFGFIQWHLLNGWPIYLQIPLFRGMLEVNETENCVSLSGTGLGIHFISYLDLSWSVQ